MKIYKITILLLLALYANAQNYTIKSGDNLWAIAKKMQVNIKDLEIANNIQDPNKIKVGQILIIPNAKSKSIKHKADISPRSSSTNDAGCDANAKKLIKYYTAVTKCQENKIYFSDGSFMIYDDYRKESFKKVLQNADIQDMFYQHYIKGSHGIPPKYNYDPGRFRNGKFFRKIYGNSASEVRSHLTTINWFGQHIKVTTINGVDKHLKAIAKELLHYPKLRKYLTPIGGTFKWRYIAGTHRLSVHSFGAAIDINVRYSAYWRWSKGGYRYQNKIPLQIVKIFEKHGFIWGGKWYHYDTMHFEYRPELLH